MKFHVRHLEDGLLAVGRDLARYLLFARRCCGDDLTEDVTEEEVGLPGAFDFQVNGIEQEVWGPELARVGMVRHVDWLYYTAEMMAVVWEMFCVIVLGKVRLL